MFTKRVYKSERAKHVLHFDMIEKYKMLYYRFIACIWSLKEYTFISRPILLFPA